MKRVVGIFLGVAFCLSPFRALAKTCQVDVSSGKKQSYRTIGAALKGSCDNIIIKPGEYIEDVIIDGDVIMSGVGEGTTIKGEIKVRDWVVLKNMTIDNTERSGEPGRKVGVELEKRAIATIYNLKIKGADIGVEASEGSRLNIVDSVITDNRKGLYIKYGTEIYIKNNKVINNKEEGIDIRAKINGQITNNEIQHNGESGIEIIVGKSKVIISNNVITDNKASGIALQFYKEDKKLGDLFIGGNTLMRNEKYGIVCKRPSGGVVPEKYWFKSIKFEYNQIKDNHKKAIHGGCKFDGPTKWKASRTKGAQDRLNKTLVLIREDYGTMPEKEIVAIINDRMKDDSKLDQEAGWWREVIYNKKKKVADETVTKINLEYNNLLKKDKKLLESTSKIREFVLGPHKQVLEDLKGDLDRYNFHLKKAKKIIGKIEVEDVKIEALKQINELEKKSELRNIYEQYKNKFGLWSWIRGLFLKN